VLVDDRKNRRAMSIQIRVRCLSCRAFAENRGLCAHERALISYLDSETAPDDDINNGVAAETTDGYGNRPELDETAAPNKFNEAGAEEEEAPMDREAIDYCSKMPRFFFACPEDEKMLLRILDLMQNSIPPPDRESCRFIFMDVQVSCPHCHTVLKGPDIIERNQRGAILHTLHHGSVDIEVIDLRCTSCRRFVLYDGMSDSLFCSNNKHMDAWLRDVCGTGGSFRDAFSSWVAKSVSTSAALHIIGKKPNLNRQRANEAFTQILMTLRFPSDSDAADLFSCTKCEGGVRDGERRMDAIVMDGTAMGILGAPPEFERVAEKIDPVSGIETKQYIMPTPIYRSFVDSIFNAAKKSDGDLVCDAKMARSCELKLII